MRATNSGPIRASWWSAMALIAARWAQACWANVAPHSSASPGRHGGQSFPILARASRVSAASAAHFSSPTAAPPKHRPHEEYREQDEHHQARGRGLPVFGGFPFALAGLLDRV